MTLPELARDWSESSSVTAFDSLPPTIFFFSLEALKQEGSCQKASKKVAYGGLTPIRHWFTADWKTVSFSDRLSFPFLQTMAPHK